MAKKTKKTTKKDTRVYVSDSSLLKKVEGVRNGTRRKDQDGNVIGGTEYFGELKK